MAGFGIRSLGVVAAAAAAASKRPPPLARARTIDPLPRSAAFQVGSPRRTRATTVAGPRAAVASPSASALEDPRPPRPSRFLDQVETTVDRALAASPAVDLDADPLGLPPSEREAFGVARALQRRIKAIDRNGDCRRCWLQRVHCVCESCPPLEGPGADGADQPILPLVRRLFLLAHHKEVGMVVDTAKLLLAAFPETARLVVAGLGRQHQESMDELEDALAGGRCLVLFPDEGALTFQEINAGAGPTRGEEVGADPIAPRNGFLNSDMASEEQWDVVVIDGTWSQARKIFNRYIPPVDKGGPTRVQLSEEAVHILGGGIKTAGMRDQGATGRQIRRHPIKWREVSTFEATRLLLRDMAKVSHSWEEGEGEMFWDKLECYQKIANDAALRQLGPPRTRTGNAPDT